MLKRMDLFPVSSQINAEGRLSLAGCDLPALAEEFGTPLYLYDQATLEASLAAYRQALEASYPGESGITYAGKAYLGTYLARWFAQQGAWLDCTGAGELYIARRAGVPRQQVLVHGVNKSQADLQAAFETAGTLVVDNLFELEQIAALFKSAARLRPELWLRIRPGLAVETHHTHTQTGQADSKFGMDAAEIRQAARFCLDHGLPVTGLHFHQGSHFHEPAPLAPAIETALDLYHEIKVGLGLHSLASLSPGGGWGVAYTEEELPHPRVEEYVRYITTRLIAGCEQRGLPLPRLQLEPGRSLTALAGVALYRVGAVKRTPHRRWLLLDGGLADNPRPALYGARYSALPVTGLQREIAGPAWLAGPYCESGDVMIEALPLPDIQPGEVLAVPVSGAYHLSMGSNYNGARKPAVVWLENGTARLIQRRETLADLTCRDVSEPLEKQL